MNKLIKKFTYILGLSMALIATGCSDDIDPEVTSLNTDRLFSPTGVTTKIVNQTGVRLTWNANNKALYYRILILQGTTTVKQINDVTNADIPYTVTGLDGETEYVAQITATATGIEDSKYTSVTFKTDAEQIFYAVNPDEIAPTSVILRWPAGETATKITLTPGNKEYTLTPADITAGSATITGLTGETTYTAKLMNGTKTRGTASFTTGVDVGGATVVKPGDDLAALLSNAAPGEAFALYPGTYGTSTKFVVKSNVEIKAVRSNNKPVISGYFSVENGASLLLKEIILDGTNNVTNQAIIFNTAGTTFGALNVQGCEIRNHDKGLFYLNVASLVESITFNNCLIYNIVCNGGDFMDSRVGAYKTLTLSNSTVYNSCAARDFVRYDNAAAYAGTAPVINITRNTLVGVSAGTTNRILYVRFVGNSINFNNNIVANTQGIFTNQAATAVPTFSNNNYFNAPGFLAGTTGLFSDGTGTQLDPKFKDASKGDFTVTNDAVKDKNVGDPRWLK